MSYSSASILSLGGVTLFVLFLSINCDYVTLYPHLQNSSHDSAGVCSLEVPTIDLLTPEQKRGVIPQGNGTKPGYSKIQICCSGWRVKPHRAFRCEPICDNGCEHGNCTAPNVCTCHPKYIKGPNGQCAPTCPIGCLNGICSNYGKCSCNSGYTLDPQGLMCVPHCPNGCGVGGKCTAPNVCQCDPGFDKTPEGKCHYHCKGGCIGGNCVGPNQCNCKPGTTNVNGVCTGICPNGCLNGKCVSNNKCECPPNMQLDATGSKCLSAAAHCSQPCLNGDCTGPEICTCKPGYIKDMSYPYGNRCVAHCPGGCENGQCSAPNFCICNIGFIKEQKGSNRCIKRHRRSIHYELIPEQY